MAGKIQKSDPSLLFYILSPLAISTFALELHRYPEILDVYIYTHIYSFLIFFSIMVYDTILNRVPCPIL